jgi:hypothetical protein
MNTTTEIEPNLLSRSAPTGVVVDPTTGAQRSHQPASWSRSESTSASKTNTHLPELTTFRALGRQVFGAQAGREYLAEAIVFVWMMAVAAWPLSVVLNQLGTMMISPPNALW